MLKCQVSFVEYGRRTVCSVALPEPFIQKDDHFPMGLEVACAPSEEAVRLNTREAGSKHRGVPLVVSQ